MNKNYRVCIGFHPYLKTAWYIAENNSARYLNGDGEWDKAWHAKTFLSQSEAEEFAQKHLTTEKNQG